MRFPTHQNVVVIKLSKESKENLGNLQKREAESWDSDENMIIIVYQAKVAI